MSDAPMARTGASSSQARSTDVSGSGGGSKRQADDDARNRNPASGSTPRQYPSKALDVTTWRDRLARTPGERQVCWALRRRHRLAVTVTRISPDSVDVTALVTGGNARPEGEPMVWRVLASNASADAEKIDAQVAEAQAWCEGEADRLAGIR